MRPRHIWSIIALLLLGTLVYFFPPGGLTWKQFFATNPRITNRMRALFLVQSYLVPAVLSFLGIVMYQVMMRVSMRGAMASVVFPFSLIGASCMMCAYRFMSRGVGGVPGYALGLALGYTLVARIYAFRPSQRTFFGKRLPVIVWRGDAAGIRVVQQQLAHKV